MYYKALNQEFEMAGSLLSIVNVFKRNIKYILIYPAGIYYSIICNEMNIHGLLSLEFLQKVSCWLINLENIQIKKNLTF